FIIVNYTIQHFRDRLIITTSDLAKAEEQHDSRLLAMFRMPYVRLIALCYGTYIFAYFFLEVAFYDYASARFQNEREMAEFIGQFFAIAGFLTLFAMVFLFAPFLRRFGILAGVIAFPIAIGVGSTSVSLMELTGADIALIFAVIVATNGMRFILQSAIWRPSVAILFQVLPDRQRSRGTALIEGVVDPLGGGIAGICLYLVSDYLDWPPKYFLLILTCLMVAWIIMGILVRRLYLSHLVVSIQKRKLGELSLAELDNASLNIIKKGLNSPYPAEIFYCLSILEEIEHPEITELIKDVIPNVNNEVRKDVMRRIAAMDIKPLIPKVDERIDLEPDPAVKAQALKTYAALGAGNVVERLLPFLNVEDREVCKGALTGLLTYDPGNDDANAWLLSLVRSEAASDRTFAAEVLGDIGLAQFSGYLVELLDDPDSSVIERAIFAAGQIRDPRLVNTLVSKMGNPVLQAAANHALKNHGESALYDLDLGLISPTAGRQEKINIIETIREIGGNQAIEILLPHIDIEMPELRHQIYLALATLHYQADPDDQYLFVNKLDEEVNKIAWLLAAMEDLYEDGPDRLVHSALGAELDVRRDNLLLLTSFLFPSIVMLETRANIDSKVSELRVFALEILENVLSTEVKQIVFPVLDDLSVSERLRYLQDKFPQRKMTPESRFNDIVGKHMDGSFYCTRATVLYQIGRERNLIHVDTLEAARRDK
ncbi:MAG: HEAT repeat domain-containing protein, partial [Pseudomonadales bacterium]|nr:HEAT repeat domain-containing protein [Pseudomonadales bacterium]